MSYVHNLDNSKWAVYIYSYFLILIQILKAILFVATPFKSLRIL